MSSKSETPGPKQWGTGRPSETGVTVPRQGDHASPDSSSSPAEACESHESHGPGGPPIRQTARFGGAAAVPPDPRAADTSNDRLAAASAELSRAELTRAELEKLRRIEAWAWRRHPFEVQSLLGGDDQADSNPWVLLEAFAWLVRESSRDPVSLHALRVFCDLEDGETRGHAARTIVERYKRAQRGAPRDPRRGVP